jgi:hypothetical protein
MGLPARCALVAWALTLAFAGAQTFGRGFEWPRKFGDLDQARLSKGQTSPEDAANPNPPQWQGESVQGYRFSGPGAAGPGAGQPDHRQLQQGLDEASQLSPPVPVPEDPAAQGQGFVPLHAPAEAVTDVHLRYDASSQAHILLAAPCYGGMVSALSQSQSPAGRRTA